jgi:glycoprotein-N-acetylgalactosamine 3-beta-galactosyltransferase
MMNPLVQFFLARFSASRRSSANRRGRGTRTSLLGRRLQELLLLIAVLWMLFYTSLVLRTARQETTTTTANRRRRRQPHLQEDQGGDDTLSTAAAAAAAAANPPVAVSLANEATQQKSVIDESQQRIRMQSSSRETAKKTTATISSSATEEKSREAKSPTTATWSLACQTPPGQSRVEGGNPMGYQVLRRLQYFLQNDPYAAAVAGDSSTSTVSNHTNNNNNNNNNETRRTTIILCILPFFSMVEQRVALETYGQDCDKVLLIMESEDASAAVTADLPETSHLYRLKVNQKGSSSSRTTVVKSIMSKLSSIEYDWIHWASPDRYLVVLSLRSFLNTPPLLSSSSSSSHESDQHNDNNTYMHQQADIDDVPQVLESWEMTNPSLSKYQSLFGGKQQQQNNKVKQRQGCLVPKTWNRAATTRFLRQCLSKEDTRVTTTAAEHSAANSSLTEWIATCVQDVLNITCSEVVIQPQAMKYSSNGPNSNSTNDSAGATAVDNHQQPEQYQQQQQQQPQQHWLHLKRYFEIHAMRSVVSSSSTRNGIGNGGGDGDSDHHRLHAILHGLCDPYWDGQLTTTTSTAAATATVERPDYHLHDPTHVRRNPLSFTYHPEHDKLGVCDYKLGSGDEGPNGIRGLEKIRLMETLPIGSVERKKILCMVYTHSGRHDQILSIAETWGPRCDGFMAASNQTNVTIGAVHIPHEGPEQYSNMWLKVRAMWQYAYDHYLTDFDFFHMGGDDHYVIAENLRFVVSTGNWEGPWNQSSPLYLGGSLPLYNKRRYCNGGSGYTLNRAALRLLVEELLPTPRCWPHWQGSDEDRIIASCFRQVHGLQCMDTNDEKNETRYHTWNVDQHVSWKAGVPGQDWESLVNEHGIAWKEGIRQVSESSVAFHLKQPRTTPQASDSGMRRYHAILYGLCRNHSL